MYTLNERSLDELLVGVQGTMVNMAFAEVNSEDSPELAQRFDVRGIPTFLVFREGQLVERLFSRDAKTIQQVRDFVAQQADNRGVTAQ